MAGLRIRLGLVLAQHMSPELEAVLHMHLVLFVKLSMCYVQVVVRCRCQPQAVVVYIGLLAGEGEEHKAVFLSESIVELGDPEEAECMLWAVGYGLHRAPV